MVIFIIIKCKDGVNYFIHQVDLHIKDIGKIINFKDMANCLIKHLCIFKCLIVEILIKYIIKMNNNNKMNKDIGNIMKVI